MKHHPLNKQQRKIGPQPGERSGKGIIGYYPEVLDEFITLDAVASGRSIARLGDGELNIALGGTAIAQREVPDKMRHEMCQVLSDPGKCMVAIPNTFSRTPKRMSWIKYATTEAVKVMTQPKYFSAFITRPDSAPWIDVPAFWSKMRGLWVNKEVHLVYGGDTSKSLKPDWLMANGALKVTPIVGKRTGAYVGIDQLEEAIGRPKNPVIICLGPAATILAWRLAKKGVWAMDLGHVGMFINSAGSFNLKPTDLASDEYRQVLVDTHAKYKEEGKPWGRSGYKFEAEIVEFYNRLGADTLLDYGCGQQTLRDALAKRTPPIRVMGYDVGFIEKSGLPKPSDLVTCTEVMEHVEPERVAAVIGHINSLCQKGAFFTISCSDSGEVLTDGRNAHIMVENHQWWLRMLQGWDNWYIDKSHYDEQKKRLLVWLVKKTAAQREATT